MSAFPVLANTVSAIVLKHLSVRAGIPRRDNVAISAGRLTEEMRQNAKENLEPQNATCLCFKATVLQRTHEHVLRVLCGRSAGRQEFATCD